MVWCIVGANAFYPSDNGPGLRAVDFSHPAAPAGFPAGGNAPDFCTLPLFANNFFCQFLDWAWAHIPERIDIILLRWRFEKTMRDFKIWSRYLSLNSKWINYLCLASHFVMELPLPIEMMKFSQNVLITNWKCIVVLRRSCLPFWLILLAYNIILKDSWIQNVDRTFFLIFKITQ